MSVDVCVCPPISEQQKRLKLQNIWGVKRLTVLPIEIIQSDSSFPSLLLSSVAGKDGLYCSLFVCAPPLLKHAPAAEAVQHSFMMTYYWISKRFTHYLSEVLTKRPLFKTECTKNTPQNTEEENIFLAFAAVVLVAGLLRCWTANEAED